MRESSSITTYQLAEHMTTGLLPDLGDGNRLKEPPRKPVITSSRETAMTAGQSIPQIFHKKIAGFQDVAVTEGRQL